MTDPTPAEIEAGAEAIAHHVRPPEWAREVARAVLRAVLPDHDARVRADERRRVAEEIARDIETAVEVDLDGRHPAAVRERQINAAVARSHAIEGSQH